MKRRILLLMMTALLSVGAWAESLWTGSETLAYYGFKLTDAVSMSVGDVLTFTVSETTTGWAGIMLKTNDMTQGYATPGTELISTSAAVGTVKIVVTSEVAAAATADGILPNAEGEGDDWSGTSLAGIMKGATKVSAYLSKKPGKINSIGFFYSYNEKQGTDDVTTLKIAKAELVKKSSGETAISSLKVTPTTQDNTIYTIGGQRVSKTVKGIYIQKGKKVIVR